MLLGVLTPSSGTVNYFGEDLQDNREAILEKVNFSSTYTNLPWDLTVKENLTYISYLYSIQNRSERVKRIVHIFKLEELLEKQLRDLSAGQITRVNLAKALLNFPKVLCTGAHRHDVLGFRHLVVEAHDHRDHFLRHRSRDDHQIALARAGAHHFHTEARQVVAARRRADHFNGAASQAEHHRPDRAASSPVVNFIYRGDDDVRFLIRQAPASWGLASLAWDQS